MIRRPLFAGLIALLLAAAAGAGLAAALAPGGPVGRTTADGATTSPSPAAPGQSPSASARPSSSPSASARLSSSPDPQTCVVGTWKVGSQTTLNLVNSQLVQFNGSGETTVYRADGTFETNFGNGTVFSANDNGVEWTETVTGTTTGHWVAQGGEILPSNLSSNGTETLRENGIYNTETPLASNPAPRPYTCSGNTLREYGSTGSAVATRQTP